MSINIEKKIRGYIATHREELIKLSTLTDQEYRLTKIYQSIVDWDKKHLTTFGTSDITIRDLKRYYLPGWSIGKISKYRRSLIEKKLLEIVTNGRIGIVNKDCLIKRQVEHRVSKAEQSDRYREPFVRRTERETNIISSGFDPISKIIKEKTAKLVQRSEQVGNSKETLNQSKKNLNEIKSNKPLEGLRKTMEELKKSGKIPP